MGENGEDFPHLPEEDINMKFLSRFLMCQWAGEGYLWVLGRPPCVAAGSGVAQRGAWNIFGVPPSNTCDL